MKKGDILQGTVESMAFGGRGVVKNEGQVIFVDGGIVGQIVEFEIKKSKKSYAEAKITRIIEASPFEQDLPYQFTPGAPWMALSLQKQRSIKREQVFELFMKFANTDLSIFIDEVIASPQEWFYRNKMEYSFGPTEESFELDEEEKKIWSHSGFGLGSKKRGQFWMVESLEKPSGMFDKQFEEAMPLIKQWCEDSGLGVYNQKTHTGFWRHLVVRKSFAQDALLLNIVTNTVGAEELDQEAFTKFLQSLPCGERITGVIWTKSDSLGDTTTNYKERRILHGKPILEEGMSELGFEISPDSFFQPNIFSAEKIYEKVQEYAQLNNGEKAMDLFCGTGTIGQILAKKNPKSSIVGVDLIESSIKNAQENARNNGIGNTEFYASDAGKFIATHPDLIKEISVVVVDPPRAGISPKSLQKIVDIKAPTLVYVSCNPSTLARDVASLKEAGYKLDKMSLIDQFPHTPHVECIARLVL